jgi:RNA polymerase sigma-70 factor (ECF subfamily)
MSTPYAGAMPLPGDVLALAQDARFRLAIDSYGREIARFVIGYEQVPARRQELLQEVHLAIWQSLAAYRGDCSLRTWVYRVTHNTCASHVRNSVRSHDQRALDLDDVEDMVDESSDMAEVNRRLDLQRILAIVHQLKIIDRQVMLLYLEGLDASEIAELTGLSPGNVATKIHRIKL